MVRWRDLTARLNRLRRETHVLFLACRDERTPWYAKLTAGVVVAYAFSPIDLIPDFIPVLGLLDDIFLIPLGIVLVRWMVPSSVMSDCRIRADVEFVTGKPVNRTTGAVIVILWATLAYLLYRVVRGWL